MFICIFTKYAAWFFFSLVWVIKWLWNKTGINLLFTPNSLEDAGTSDLEEPRDEDSYNDINVDQLLNNFQLVGRDKRMLIPNAISHLNSV